MSSQVHSARPADPSGKGGKSLWAWGAAAGATIAAGAAAFNAVRSRKTERANPPVGEFMEVDGVRLHYLERGSGPLVVLLHGNATMIQDWLASGVLDELAKTNRVIAFDRVGFGYTDRPRTVLWTPAAQARLIARALAAKGEGEAIIVGHSFGTLVAVALGLDHPEVVRSLLLIGGYYYPSARVDAAFAAPPAIPVVGDAIRYTVSPLLGAAMRPMMEKQIFAPAAVSGGWRADFPFEMTLRPCQIRAAAAEAAIMVPAAAALSPRYGDLKLPISVIAGKGDKVVSTADQSERFADAVPHSELALAEGAGHMAHHSAPDLVVSIIRSMSAS